MNIGLDLSVLQTPHRMRGIGATAINFVNNLSPQIKKKHHFILYLNEDHQDQALELLKLQNLDYEIRNLTGVRKHVSSKVFRFNTGMAAKFKTLRPIRLLLDNLYLLKRAYISIHAIYRGNFIENNLEGVDAFLQFDQLGPLPKSKKIRKARILYDVIPYVMESDYLWSYRTARARGDSRKSSLRKEVHRRLYKTKTRAAAKSADILIAISEHTKKDFIRCMNINDSQIRVVHLGIPQESKGLVAYPRFKHFTETSWGYMPRSIDLKKQLFLLYVGGADPRRKITDLVAAFNHLRAEGVDIRLVMAGDTMQGARAIPVPETQKSLLDSSYLEDIIFLGFVNDKQKDWLYQNALAFVYPSVYEGFGLPILEAMQYGCPVITFKNTSVQEITDDACLFTTDSMGIHDHIIELMQQPKLRERLKKQGKINAASYSWEQTTSKIMTALVN